MTFQFHCFSRVRRTCVRALLALALAIVSATAVRAQGWTVLPNPGAPILEHTATLLLDGRVLVVSKSAPPMLFDPRSGSWSPTTGAPAELSRSLAAATLLTDGRVLVTGGAILPDGTPTVPALTTTHLFDPRTNGWTPAASLGVPRYAPAIARLGDGRVVVAGGKPDAGPIALGVPWSTAEIYDPVTNTWTPVPGLMTTGRYGSNFVPQPDGRLLIAGGAQNDRSADLFDPNTQLFLSVAPSSGSRVQTLGLLLGDGTTWLSGDGQLVGNSGVASRQPELLSSPTGPWGPTPLYGPVLPSAALLPDGRSLIVPNGGGAPATFYLPDGGLGTYEATLLDHTGGSRVHPTMTMLPDGRALLLGGTMNTLFTANVFDARTITSAPTSSSDGMTDTWTAASALLPDGRVLVAGGMGSHLAAQRASAALYDPATDVWEALPPMSTPRVNDPEAIVLRDGRVMVLGGSSSNAGTTAVDILNPATNSWTAGAPLNSARFKGATVALSNGWVLTFGGVTVPPGPMASAEMYIPEIDRWIPIAPMPAPRWRMSAVRLPDDRVLVAGGLGASGDVSADAWIYDYRTDQWTPTGSLNVARQDTQMQLLPDGMVILVGTDDNSRSEIWDPATGTWTLIPMAGVSVIDGVLVTLPTGEVALVAGRISAALASREIKIFDPASRTWRAATPLGVGRRHPEVVVLPDGRLLVAGGDLAGALPAAPELVTISRGRDPLRLPGLSPVGTLMQGGTPTLQGSGFAPPHAGSASVGSISSATNQPFVAYRSLVSREQRFLPVDAFDNGNAHLRRLIGRSLGPALIDVRVNGIRSDVRLATIDAPVPTASATVANVRFSAADRTITLTAQYASAITPLGGVAIALITGSNGTLVGTPAAPVFLDSGGNVSFSYTVPGGTPIGTYTATIVYAGDSLHAPIVVHRALQILPIQTMMTILPAAATVERGVPVMVAASVTPAQGGPVSGTIELAAGADGCSFAAPSGGCELTFPHPGAVTIDGTFTPAAAGPYEASAGQAVVNVSCPAITLTPAVLPIGRIGEPYSVTFGAAGGFAPYTFVLDGTLPDGLTFDGQTLSGTPGAAVDGTLVVHAREAGEACQGEQTYALTITAELVREYTLAEGASNSFFSSFILIANPNPADAPVVLTYVGEQGTIATETRTLAPFSRVTIPTGAGSIASQAGPTFATRVTSQTGAPLVVERATYFDASLRAGDLSSASDGAGSTRWHFAEGANGFFHTYLTLGNLHSSETATVTVRYLPEAGAAFERQYTVAPDSRKTIDTAKEPALATGAFAMTLESSTPIAADRVQYFGSPFIGAHADSGARALSPDWYFAEGASGRAFDTYLLLGNPSAEAANVTVTFHTGVDAPMTRAYAVPAGARRSIDVAAEDPRLAVGTFWTEVHADRPIVAERAMYLVDPANGGWIEATDSTGATAPALRWGLAEGAAGLSLGYAPYVLIANPGMQTAEVTVEYLRSSGALVSHAYSVPAQGRITIDVRGEEPSLADTEFGIVVSSTNHTPIIVERSQYWTLGGATFVGAMNTMGTPLPPVAPPQR